MSRQLPYTSNYKKESELSGRARSGLGEPRERHSPGSALLVTWAVTNSRHTLAQRIPTHVPRLGPEKAVECLASVFRSGVQDSQNGKGGGGVSEVGGGVVEGC